MAKKYIVDPCNPDGTLDAKDPYNCFGTFAADGVTEEFLFKRIYFPAHPDEESASWDQLRAFFATKGWTIREKNY